MSSRKNLNKYINKLKLDYRIFKAHQGFLRGLILGFVFSIFIFILNYFEVRFLARYRVFWYYLIFFPVLGLLLNFVRPVSKKEVLQKTDQKMELKEKLITYYEYMKNESQNPFIGLLKEDVFTRLKKVEKQRIFDFNWFPELKYVGIVFFVFIFILAGGGEQMVNYPVTVREDRSQLRTEIEGEIEEGEVTKDILKDDSWAYFDDEYRFEESDRLPEDAEQTQDSAFSRADKFRGDIGDRDQDLTRDYSNREGEENDFEDGDEEGQGLGDRESTQRENGEFPGDEIPYDDYDGRYGEYYDMPGEEGDEFAGGMPGDDLPEDYDGEELDSGITEDSQSLPGDFPDEDRGYEGELERQLLDDYVQDQLALDAENGDYISAVLEELYDPDEDGIERDFDYEYRRELINALSQEEIPVVYKNLIEEYFSLLTSY